MDSGKSTACVDLDPTYCFECGFVIDRDPYVRQCGFDRDTQPGTTASRYYFAYFLTWCYAEAYGIVVNNEAEASVVAPLGSAENPIVIDDDEHSTHN